MTLANRGMETANQSVAHATGLGHRRKQLVASWGAKSTHTGNPTSYLLPSGAVARPVRKGRTRGSENPKDEIWSVRVGGEVVNLLHDELVAYVRTGAFAADVPVSRSGMLDWAPLCAVPELAPIVLQRAGSENHRTRAIAKLASGLPHAGDRVGDALFVVRELGTGSMGRVYLAQDTALHRLVAIKVLRPECAARPGMRAMFLREARLAAGIRNPHVVGIHGWSTLAGGLPYIVMEYLPGEDLARVISAEAPIDVATAVRWVLETCLGLAPVHATGFVHRDIKPANLFLLRRAGKRRIVLLDFGIAEVTRALNRRPSQQPHKGHRLFGSPAYMAPEQFDFGSEVDHHADIWALGVVLYELVTGRLPFSGGSDDDLMALMNAVRQGWFAPLPGDAECIAPVVDRCLRNRPEARYSSVLELVRALRRFRG